MKRWYTARRSADPGGRGQPMGLRGAMPAAVEAQSAPPTVAAERGEVSVGRDGARPSGGTREMVLLPAPPATVEPARAAPASTWTLAPRWLASTLPRWKSVMATAQAELELALCAWRSSRSAPRPQTWPRQWRPGWRTGDWMRWHAGRTTANWLPHRRNWPPPRATLAQLQSPDVAALQNAQYTLETARNSLWSVQVARATRQAGQGCMRSGWRPLWATPTSPCAERRKIWPGIQAGPNPEGMCAA